MKGTHGGIIMTGEIQSVKWRETWWTKKRHQQAATVSWKHEYKGNTKAVKKCQ